MSKAVVARNDVDLRVYRRVYTRRVYTRPIGATLAIRVQRIVRSFSIDRSIDLGSLVPRATVNVSGMLNSARMRAQCR